MDVSERIESPRAQRLLPAFTVGAGALACAACCAVPLLAVLGVGTGVAGAIVSWVEPLGLVLVPAGVDNASRT